MIYKSSMPNVIQRASSKKPDEFSVLKKGGTVKKKDSLRRDFERLAGSNTHGTMDREPSLRKLHAKKREIADPKHASKRPKYESPAREGVMRKSGGRMLGGKGISSHLMEPEGAGRILPDGGDGHMMKKGGHRKCATGGMQMAQNTNYNPSTYKKGGKAKKYAKGGNVVSVDGAYMPGTRLPLKKGGQPKKERREHHSFGDIVGGIGNAVRGAGQALGNAASSVGQGVMNAGRSVMQNPYGRAAAVGLVGGIPGAAASGLASAMGYKRGGRPKKKCDGGKMATGGHMETKAKGRGKVLAVDSDNPVRAKGGKWIQKAIKHPGALHKELGIAAGRKIPESRIKKAEHSKNPTLARRARLADTLKSMHHRGGGRGR